MDDLVGKCVEDKYDVEKLIASGGMGEVYLAHQKGTEQIVAIKKLKREYYQDHVAVERFINEAKVYGRVTHPNAVKLHDVLNVDGQLCIVMEYVDGKTLAQYVAEHYVFSMRQIIDIALQIADALAAVHKAGIVHRDLKTDNIMLIESVSGRFAVKILDFGIAKIKDGCPNTLTQQGTLVGTPAFMSPEQCYGMPADHRSDIYSYGLILFFIICGRLPFEASSALAMMHKQADEPLPALKRPDSSKVPGGLEGIVQKCTMKKAEDRYQSFVDVIADLTCLQEGRKTSVERSAASAGKTLSLLMKIGDEASDSSRKSRRNLIIGCVVVCLIAGLVSFIFMLRQNMPVEVTGTQREMIPAPEQRQAPEPVHAEAALAQANMALNDSFDKSGYSGMSKAPETDMRQPPKLTDGAHEVGAQALGAEQPLSNPVEHSQPAQTSKPKETISEPRPKVQRPTPQREVSAPVAKPEAPAPVAKPEAPAPVAKPEAPAPVVKPEAPATVAKPEAPAPSHQGNSMLLSPKDEKQALRQEDPSVSGLLALMDDDSGSGAKNEKSSPARKNKLTSLIQISSTSPCSISIDGKSYGSTPKKVELTAGTYKIKCTDDKESREKTITLSDGDEKKISF